MKADYKNWVPKGMLVSLLAATGAMFALFLLFGFAGIVSGAIRIAFLVVVAVAFLQSMI